MTHAIEVQDLKKSFGSNHALNGIDLAVPRGAVFGLIGSNGAGKTTTMRVLLDIVRPTSGSVSVFGIDPREGGPALRRRIGYLPGELILDGRSTGRQLLKHYASISGPVRAGRIEELAARFDVPLDRSTHKLSKGNKQKLGLIQAFMHEPDLLVLDEPTSGLDPLVQQTFHELVREAQTNGQTVLLSSHVLSEIESIAEQLAVVRKGKVVSASTVTELRAAAKRRVQATITDRSKAEVVQLLSSVTELSEVTVARSDDNTTTVTGRLSGGPDAFIRALASCAVADVTIAAPNLEDAVLDLYDARPSSGAAPTLHDGTQEHTK
ncbi:ABC transporter ATP-binding protein [Leucobacter insecticola]|uniref:ABC transporter ATP-binding protein n=1 Tax=Leucobacter insecticola TaxID=2714934 RepID=A0A6G8FKY9_9MICO|nr:ABC transporter ATP-binding protein [Leucobacter insecticola]QIM17035.1 ABC transporter ATP-binding protein [Leucobacter insecticola]